MRFYKNTTFVHVNILFVNNSEINPLSSGIQRITSILTQAFTRQGITCYGANFETHTPSDHTLFPDTLKLDFSRQASQRLVGFIRKYGITRVIVQECMPLKNWESYIVPRHKYPVAGYYTAITALRKKSSFRLLYLPNGSDYGTVPGKYRH